MQVDPTMESALLRVLEKRLIEAHDALAGLTKLRWRNSYLSTVTRAELKHAVEILGQAHALKIYDGTIEDGQRHVEDARR